jgi:hypothetical protein
LPAQWRKQVSSQLEGASPALIDAVVKIEPWDTGRDSLLRDVHELDRIDKHRLLLQVAVAYTGIGLEGDSYELAVTKKFSGVKAENPLMLAPLQWSPLEEGKILIDVKEGEGLKATNATLTFDLRLGDPERMREQSAVTWLRILAGLTEKVIRDLAPLA